MMHPRNKLITAQEEKMTTVAQRQSAAVVKDVESKFGSLVEIYLCGVTLNARNSPLGIATIGPLDDQMYKRIREALIEQPTIPSQFGIDIIRYDDADNTIRAIVADCYKQQRQMAIVAKTPIAFSAMCDASESAKKLNLTNGVLSELNDEVQKVIEEFVKEEKDVDIVFGVETFVFQEALRCLPNTVIEDGYLEQVSAKARDSADGWGIVTIPEKLIDRLEAHTNTVDLDRYNVSGFAIDRDSRELRAIVLRPEAE